MAFARSRLGRRRTMTRGASRPSSTPLPVEQRCGSMPIAHTWRPTPAALPHPSIPPASSCSNSHAIPTIGANANVAKVSTVPIMLDEPFCGLDDIERAADIPNVGFCKLKLKLKRFGSLDALKQALERVRELGMEPVLGDGISSELQCWMEGCVARHVIQQCRRIQRILETESQAVRRAAAVRRRIYANDRCRRASYPRTRPRAIFVAREALKPAPAKPPGAPPP